MVCFNILAGDYGFVIAAYQFCTDPTASLTLTGQTQTAGNPSWITAHPTNPSIIYGVNEQSPGGLQSFTVSAGVLSGPINTVETGGDSPAFAVALSTGQVAAANYEGGNVRVVPTTDDGLAFDESAVTLNLPLADVPDSVSHPHMVLEYGEELFVPDLGQDKTWRLTQDGSPGLWKITGEIPQPAGSGPRHIAVYEDNMYTLHELSSTLTVQAVPSAPNGTSEITADASITPPNLPEGAAFAAGEILIPGPSDKFPTPYIYVSNRNTGTQDPAGDSIAIFEHTEDGQLQLINQVFTGIDQVRGMEFGTACEGGEEYLIAGGVVGTAGVIVFQRTDEGRNLTEVTRNTDLPTRTSFVWLC